MFILMGGTKLIANTVLLAKLPSSPSSLRIVLVQVVRGGVPGDRLILGAGLWHVVPALLVAVETAILWKMQGNTQYKDDNNLSSYLTPEASSNNAPKYRVTQVTVCGGGVVILLKPVRVSV